MYSYELKALVTRATHRQKAKEMGIKETKEHETTILGCKVKIPLNQPPLTQEEKDSEKTKKRKKLDEQIRTPVLTRHKSKQKNTKIVTRKNKPK